MLLAALLLLILTAAVFAVTQIGALVTLLFIVAVLVLAYQRLPLLAVFAGLHRAVRGVHVVRRARGRVERPAAAACWR